MSLTTCLYNNKKISINDFNLLDDKNKRNNVKCICCNSKLIPKLGKIKVHHFAHENKIECDTFRTTDSMTFWHQYWQSFVDTKYFEVVIEKNGKKHIADIYNPTKNLIIEIQHSNISQQKIKEREDFYDNMIWLIDETTKCCENCEITLCNECEYFNKICNNCKNKDCCKNKIISLFSGETFEIIKNTNSTFFLSSSKPVFLHVDNESKNYILKFIRILGNNNFFCEKIKIENFISNYFPIKYDLSKIVNSFNDLFYKMTDSSQYDCNLEHTIDNDKITIKSHCSDLEYLLNVGFKYYKERQEYVYFFNKNQKYCYKCELNLAEENSEEYCKECFTKSEHNFTYNWYNLFENNEIVSKKINSEKISHIEFNLENPIIIKTKNNIEFVINKNLYFKNDNNYKYDKSDGLYIYFDYNKLVNYKDDEINLIEKIIIYGKTFYRIQKEYPIGCLLDLYGKNLYLTLNFVDKYTYISPIKRNKEFLKEFSKITKQNIKWNLEPLTIEYDYINYDELLENEDIRIKYIFYCINFKIKNYNYYNIIGLMGCYSKNKIILELFLKWLDKFRNCDADTWIDFGKYNDQYYYNLKYEYLLWLKENPKVYANSKFNYIKRYDDKDRKLFILISLSQHPDQCKK